MIQLKRWGSNIGLLIPQKIAESFGLKEDSIVVPTESQGCLIIAKKQGELTLDELLSSIPNNFRYPDDVMEFVESEPLGQELLWIFKEVRVSELILTQGREQSGNARPCLVISHTQFNQSRQGIVIVHPITSTIKPEIKMMIPIPKGFKVQGSIIVEQIRTLDLNQRWWKATGEILPEDFVNLVVQTFSVIVKQ
jgi:mRNA interferase MazF